MSASTNLNTNPVVKRIAVKASCVFISPALIGCGFGENTDSDVLRDRNGEAFLPGTTVAGVLRSIVSDAKVLFGKQEGETDRPDIISPLWVFDAKLTTSDQRTANVVEIDGVALGRENKVANEKEKYIFEAVETGTRFTLRFLLTIRENDRGKGYETLLKKTIGVLKSDSIALGAKTRRGFGATQCYCVVKREFDLQKDNVAALEKWLNFDWDLEQSNPEDWECAESEDFFGSDETFTVKLKLDGSIMIRDTRNVYDDYSEKEKEEKVPNYKHISSANKPVIFGTSWAGAFRSGLFRLLKQRYPSSQNPDKVEQYLDEVFGYVEKLEDEIKARAEASQVVFGTSFLKEIDNRVDGYRRITRVKIDRFTGGAADGALFMEMPWYGGETTLAIRYPRDRVDIRQLILLGLDAINHGIIQIGGETSVGRGFFKITDVVDSKGPVLIDEPKQELRKFLDDIGTKKAGE
ncbi:MAG: RAMP superfamily CRISPR-associated protein [Peptococcaceae bacterium]|nr:RAMP superfamily CRISPR-associated protein [Peptococcaceae bacterium]